MTQKQQQEAKTKLRENGLPDSPSKIKATSEEDIIVKVLDIVK